MDLKVSNKRKPIISIIISSDNDCERLKKCINSFLSFLLCLGSMDSFYFSYYCN